MKKKPQPRHLTPPAPVRVVSGSFIRIVMLACFALAGAIFALVLHYRGSWLSHERFSPPPSSTLDAGELQAPELLPVESSSATP